MIGSLWLELCAEAVVKRFYDQLDSISLRNPMLLQERISPASERFLLPLSST